MTDGRALRAMFTREEFERERLTRMMAQLHDALGDGTPFVGERISAVTDDQIWAKLYKLGMVAIECNCGKGDCCGWQFEPAE
jgi:hypothetical protein